MLDDKGSIIRGKVILPEGQQLVKTGVFTDLIYQTDYVIALMKNEN